MQHPNPDFVVKYDPARNASREAWRRDHTLRTAFRDSVRWKARAILADLGVIPVTEARP